MIKIRLNNEEREFKSEREAMKFVAATAQRQSLNFQRLEYSNGKLEEMDYLTYHKGHVSETYNTKS